MKNPTRHLVAAGLTLLAFAIPASAQEITITFVRDGGGEVTQMIFAVGADEMPAKKM